MRTRSITLVGVSKTLACLLLLSSPPGASAQEPASATPETAVAEGEITGAVKLGAAGLRKRWSELEADAGWKALMGEAGKRGFRRAVQEARMWGVDGEWRAQGRAKEKVQIVVYDLESDAEEGGAIVRIQRGKRIASMLLEVPKGGSIEDAVGSFVDDSNRVQRIGGSAAEAGTVTSRGSSTSWLGCLYTRITKGNKCTTTCAVSWGGCSLAASVFGPFSPSAFFACMFATCGTCITLQAVICGF